MKPEIDDDHQVIVDMPIDLWFRGMEFDEEKSQRNEKSLGSYDFANQAEGKQVTGLDTSNISFDPGRFRAGPTTDDREATRLAGKRTGFGGK